MRVLLVHPRFPDPYGASGACTLLKQERNKYIMPPLGLLTVAALLPPDWDFKLIDMMIEEVSDEDLSHSDVVMITGMGLQDTGIMELIARAKARRRAVVVGGAWAYHCAQIALDLGADIVVRGEAEPVAQLLIEAIKGETFGKIIEAVDRTDMTQVPVPRFDLIQVSDYYMMTVQFSRGCPFKCEFCDVINMLGNRVRTKSVTQVINELDALYESGYRGSIFISDDNFIGSPVRAKRLLREMIPWLEAKKRPFEFLTQVPITLSQHDELIDLMVQAGFWMVNVGIESTEANVLKSAGKLQNVSVDVEEACHKLNRAGLTVSTNFMIGFDSEAPGADKRVIDFVRRNGIPEVYVHPFRATPGTRLWKRLQEEGRLLPDNMTGLGNHAGLVNFITTRPREEIAREQMSAISMLYDPGDFLERAYHHIENMKPPPFKSRLRSWVEVRGALGAIYFQGWVYPSRWKFWLLLAKTLLRHRKRIALFLRLSGHGVAYHEAGKIWVEQLARHINQIGSSRSISGEGAH